MDVNNCFKTSPQQATPTRYNDKSASAWGQQFFPGVPDRKPRGGQTLFPDEPTVVVPPLSGKDFPDEPLPTRRAPGGLSGTTL